MSIVTGKLPPCVEPVDLVVVGSPAPDILVLKSPVVPDPPRAPAQPPKFKRPRPSMRRNTARK